MTKDQEMLMAVVLDYIRTSQRDAMRSKACCRAILYLNDSMSAEEFEENKFRLMQKWVDEDYPGATDKQKANLVKLFGEV